MCMCMKIYLIMLDCSHTVQKQCCFRMELIYIKINHNAQAHTHTPNSHISCRMQNTRFSKVDVKYKYKHVIVPPNALGQYFCGLSSFTSRLKHLCTIKLHTGFSFCLQVTGIIHFRSSIVAKSLLGTL